ncbi:MAG: hypothetical protein ACOVQX_00725 [Legionella sp.]
MNQLNNLPKMIRWLILYWIGILGLSNALASSCHPEPNNALPQYIIGYGSLISEASKRSTYSNVGDNIPVIVNHYQRGWYLKGPSVRFNTTFLGVKPDKNAKINAVVFSLPKAERLNFFDRRESGYCRILVKPSLIHSLTNQVLPKAQFWIYVPSLKQIAIASAHNPIVQSYVDIFLSGCLELEKKYHINDFAKNCIRSTSNWSEYWINDRIYPRRPWVYQPNALAIDRLLSSEVAEYFKAIKIEGASI